MMNREIKFRAWDGKRMYYFDNHQFNLEYNDISGWNVYPNQPNYKGKYTTGESSESAEKFELMQFTGLKDKNGIDIYEGDIVNIPYNRIGSKQVIYLPKEVKFSISGYNVNVIEVIGNIHENPELL